MQKLNKLKITFSLNDSPELSLIITYEDNTIVAILKNISTVVNPKEVADLNDRFTTMQEVLQSEALLYKDGKGAIKLSYDKSNDTYIVRAYNLDREFLPYVFHKITGFHFPPSNYEE